MNNTTMAKAMACSKFLSHEIKENKMVLYQIKQILRFLKNNKLFSIVNTVGLSISISLVLLLSIYITKENNVDSFHQNQNRIYRVLRANECAFSPAFGQYIVDNIEGVESFCRTFILDATLKSEKNIVKTPNCYYVDDNFFQMFSFPLVEGAPNKVLESKNNVVLSESFAEKMFPNEEPVGKKLRINNRLDYVVSGIAKDFDESTHFKQADVIFPFMAMNDFWGNPGYDTQYDLRIFMPSLYVMASENSELSGKGEELYNRVKSWYWLFQEDGSNKVEFQPLSKVYLNAANYGYPLGVREGNGKLIRLVTFIVLGILVIAVVNFINLTISYSIKRRNEIGVKKVVGALKKQVFAQSLMETGILFGISLIIAVLFLFTALPAFNKLTAYNLTVPDIPGAIDWQKIVFSLVLFYLLAGIIPAIVVSGNNFTAIVKNKMGEIRLNYIQRVLVVLQFTVSTVLIVSMLTVIKQNKFLRDYDVGFNTSETFFINLNSEIKNKKLAFKEELKKIPGIQNVALCNSMPGVGIMNLRFKADNKTQDIDLFNIDAHYFEVMDIKLKNLTLPDANVCWINESAAKSLGYNSSDNTIEIDVYGTKRSLIVNEVLQDMNFHSLYELARPAVFTKLNTEGWVDYTLVRVNKTKLNDILTKTEELFSRFSPNFAFNFSFVDDKMNEVYEKETRTSKIVIWFSVFALLISSLGIYTLAVFSSNKRIKEIGIRKVNGAKTMDISSMLNKEFIKWVLISFLIATPVAWFAMNRWLENFAYKTELSWWIFGVAGIITLSIAVISVSWQSLSAASKNPVDALRYE